MGGASDRSIGVNQSRMKQTKKINNYLKRNNLLEYLNHCVGHQTVQSYRNVENVLTTFTTRTDYIPTIFRNKFCTLTLLAFETDECVDV